MSGLVCGFVNCVDFVDGKMQRVFMPKDGEDKQDRFEGHHQFISFGVLSWTAIFGTIIRIGIELEGSRHDRGLYKYTEPVILRSHLFD